MERANRKILWISDVTFIKVTRRDDNEKRKYFSLLLKNKKHYKRAAIEIFIKI